VAIAVGLTPPQFHAMAPIDGVWIDMNEISNMCDGECPHVPPVADRGTIRGLTTAARLC
jgi:hypothetical protein